VTGGMQIWSYLRPDARKDTECNGK
jgi:hypothetical protein